MGKHSIQILPCRGLQHATTPSTARSTQLAAPATADRTTRGSRHGSVLGGWPGLHDLPNAAPGTEQALHRRPCRVCSVSRCAVHNSTARGPQRPVQGHDQLRSVAGPPIGSASSTRSCLQAACHRQLAGSKRRGSMPAELKFRKLEGELRLFRPLWARTCSEQATWCSARLVSSRKRAWRRSAGALADAPRLRPTPRRRNCRCRLENGWLYVFIL